jgi:hypothetical protein
VSILLTVLGIALIVVGALLALASIVGFQRAETVRASITLAVGALVIIGGATLVATN